LNGGGDRHGFRQIKARGNLAELRPVVDMANSEIVKSRRRYGWDRKVQPPSNLIRIAIGSFKNLVGYLLKIRSPANVGKIRIVDPGQIIDVSVMCLDPVFANSAPFSFIMTETHPTVWMRNQGRDYNESSGYNAKAHSTCNAGSKANGIWRCPSIISAPGVNRKLS
jgi:hypothetical protein